MKKQFPIGVVIEGADAGSALLEIPGAAEQIGSVKSSSLRNARRFCNSLKVGRGISAYEELSPADVVLVCVPDTSLNRIMDEILHSSLNLKKISFVACGTWLPSSQLGPLRSAGASVGTLLRVPGATPPHGFICEGDPHVCRHMRRLFDRSRATLFHIKRGEKALYFAAEMLITAVPLPSFFAAQRALRQAGVSGNLLSALMDQLTTRLLRNFRAGPRPRVANPPGFCSRAAASAYLNELADKLPNAGKVLEAIFPRQG